ncbi:MAG TPA: hypothetical protein VF503_10145 [Sphingobium sp.]
MNPWPFVIAAYALTAIGTVAVSLWSWGAARNAERRADSLRRERD